MEKNTKTLLSSRRPRSFCWVYSMPTKKDFTDYILDQIGDERARVHAMFGEYALYYDEKVVALVCDETVYAKITESSSEVLQGNEREPAYPGAKPSFVLEDEQIEESGFLRELCRGIAADLPAPKAKKHSKKAK
jgi:TfoX/Sxy family transcriptional regulator of competence genes